MGVELTPFKVSIDPYQEADGELSVIVKVPREARFGNVAYSDHDKAVLVSFVVILPAAVLDAAGDLMGLFDIDLDTGTSFSTQLVAVHDLGED